VSRRTSRRARAAVLVAGLVGAVVAVPTAAQAAPLAGYQMPFTCGQVWNGSSRPTHSPSALSIDWNRDGDLGSRVLAPWPGVVTRVENLGSRSYGLYVILDHGNGETTLYAHLSAEYVTVGQRVDAGELIAAVGSSGGSTGPHLHFEERKNGTDVQPYFDGVAFKFPSNLASRNCPDTPITGDWNGDGKDEIGTFSRKVHGWFNRLSAGKVVRSALGGGADQPLVGDWDGDGKLDVGVRRSRTADFVLRPASGAADRKITLGAVEDRADVGYWRPSTATFTLRRANGTLSTVKLGTVGQLPVTGDWNGDGITDLGTYNPSTAVWSLRVQAKDGTVWTAAPTLGNAGDLPAPGDWNGDGTTDLGTWSPSTATWTQRIAATVNGGSPRIVTKVFGATR
jgi:hypothetical protein